MSRGAGEEMVVSIAVVVMTAAGRKGEAARTRWTDEAGGEKILLTIFQEGTGAGVMLSICIPILPYQDS